MVQSLPKHDILHHRVLTSTIANYTGKAATLAIGFLLTSFMVHRLGTTNYGLWVIISAIAGYSALGDLGIPGGVVKYVAEFRARQEFDDARRLIATALTAGAILGFIAGILGLFLAPVISHWFGSAPHERRLVIGIVATSGIVLGAAIFSRFTQAVLQGLQRFDVLNLLNVATALIFALATVIVLLLHGGVLGVALASAATTLLMQLPTVWCISHAAPELHLTWHGARRSYLRLILPYSSAFVADQAAWRLKTETDELVIGVVLSVAAATPYALARRLSLLAQSFTDQFLTVLVPLAAELHAGANRQRLRSLFIASTRLTLAIFLPMSLILAIFAGPILSVWVGNAYARYAHLVVILTAATLIDLILWPAGGILKVMARYRLVLISAATTALVNVALSVVLALRFGVTGVALGTLIPAAIEAFGFVLPYAMRILAVDARTALRSLLLPPLLPATPIALVLIVVRRVISPSSLFQLSLVAVCTVVLYAGLYMAISASAAEREACQAVARRLLRMAHR